MNKGAAKPTSGRTIILLLAAVAMLGSLATQLIVPALPRMAADLGADTAAIQLVIGIYLIGLAGGQLVAGPLSDRLGRKPVMLGGLVLFIIGCLIAWATHSIAVMLFARVLQAVGAAAGIVSSRVMVSDYFPPDEAPTRQATMMAVVLLSPAVAPVIGGLVTELAGWRAIFAALVGCALINALLAVPMLPPPTQATPLASGGLRSAYAGLARNRAFLYQGGAVAAGSAALYTYLASAPFLFQHRYGLGPRDSGLCLLLIAAASILGTKFVGPLSRKGNGPQVGAALIAAGAVLLVLLVLAGFDNLVAMLAATSIVGLGAGIAGPSGITKIIQSAPGVAGTASSLAGAVQMAASALAAATLGHAATQGPLQLGLGLSACGLAAVALAWLASRAPMQGLA